MDDIKTYALQMLTWWSANKKKAKAANFECMKAPLVSLCYLLIELLLSIHLLLWLLRSTDLQFLAGFLLLKRGRKQDQTESGIRHLILARPVLPVLALSLPWQSPSDRSSWCKQASPLVSHGLTELISHIVNLLSDCGAVFLPNVVCNAKIDRNLPLITMSAIIAII